MAVEAPRQREALHSLVKRSTVPHRAAARYMRLTADYGPADDFLSFFHVLRRVREIRVVDVAIRAKALASTAFLPMTLAPGSSVLQLS